MKVAGTIFLRSAVFILAVFAWTFAALPIAHASTIWTGPLFTYSQPTSDPTLQTNQDHLILEVWLTRAMSKGLFNAATETNATQNSPADTEWAFGTLNNYSNLTYQTWLGMLNGASPTTLVGQPLVVHLISEDIYLSLTITVWGSHAAGGFAYQRSTPVAPMISGAAITNGQFIFFYNPSPGLNYVVQNSPDLTNWSSIATNLASTNIVLFQDTVIPNQFRFYRVAQMPAN